MGRADYKRKQREKEQKRAEQGSNMPKARKEDGERLQLRCGRYRIYFWSNENQPPRGSRLEDIHVHIAERPCAHAPKIWIAPNRELLIDEKMERELRMKVGNELRKIKKVIKNNIHMIEAEWKRVFGEDSIRYKK